MNGQPPCWLSNKQHHHGGAICCNSSMAVANQPVLPLGVSLEGVGQGQCVSVLLNLADRLRKKKRLNSTIYFSFINSICALSPPRTMILHMPHALPWSRTLSILSSIVNAFIGGQFMPLCISFSFQFFCVGPFEVQNNGTAFPHMLHPPHATSSTSKLPLTLINGWLLCFPFKFWPLKAKATPIALFFDGVCTGTPNEGTSRGAAKPAGASLSWNQWETLHQELGPWRMLPWQ